MEITVARPDGTRPKTISVWVVLAEGRLFLRSHTKTEGGWYDTALKSGRGAVAGGGISREARFVTNDGAAINAAVDQVHRYPVEEA